MRKLVALISIVMLPAMLAADAYAQASNLPTGKIVCWKDRAGKVIGCGDKVPPEHLDSGTKELNQRGVTVRQSDAALTAEQKKAQQAEIDRRNAEELKKREQRRQDKALLDTFSNEKEIDLKRGRDVQLIESNIETLQTNLKNAEDRQADSRARMAQYTKNKKPVPVPVQEEFDRVEGEKAKINAQIAQKRREIATLHQTYDELKKRFIELKTGVPASATPADKPQPSPPTAAQPAPAAKK